MLKTYFKRYIIKDLTPVRGRGQDGKISDTQGKDFWRPIDIFPAGV
jgi:hypothetical protein